ncbi:T9SS type A sorting domain-containing protein [Dysgonomonas sp. 520]|uniref:T9SS type A sorting domain-containing protein n=1 Tax=Dysgonomonas sp. 520 TaxID=2302931 RepID=UPI0013CF60DD|nr:T9SS type A sorting domain-containing protein [Dysgonomonas sp. 520]NDW11027.1 T9SS C-terminal target domain-containing protein [Dysgonomonas sp. 520]
MKQLQTLMPVIYYSGIYSDRREVGCLFLQGTWSYLKTDKVDVSALVSGTYFIRIQAQDGISTLKFLK